MRLVEKTSEERKEEFIDVSRRRNRCANIPLRYREKNLFSTLPIVSYRIYHHSEQVSRDRQRRRRKKKLEKSKNEQRTCVRDQ